MNDRQIRLSVFHLDSFPVRCTLAVRAARRAKRAACLGRRSLPEPRRSAIGAERKCRNRSLLASRLLSNYAARITAAKPKLCRWTANGKDLLSGIDGCSPRDDHRAVKRQAEIASRRSE